MKYSINLLKKFKDQYKKSFGEEIDLQVAEAELNKLAHCVEGFLSRKDNNNQGE